MGTLGTVGTVGFRKFYVWKKAHELVVEVYRATNTFPDDERYGLTSQLRRAAASVPANFAEGYARGTTKQFLHFLSISKGSLSEVEYFLELSRDVGVLPTTDFKKLESIRSHVGLLLHRFVVSIGKNEKGQKR